MEISSCYQRPTDFRYFLKANNGVGILEILWLLKGCYCLEPFFTPDLSMLDCIVWSGAWLKSFPLPLRLESGAICLELFLVSRCSLLICRRCSLSFVRSFSVSSWERILRPKILRFSNFCFFRWKTRNCCVVSKECAELQPFTSF